MHIYGNADSFSKRNFEEVAEYTRFTADGYYLHFLPSTSVPDYLKVVEAAKRILFGYGSKGIRIEFSLYSIKVDWWINVTIVYEFGINE